jgi:hypothetical protein
MSRLASTTRTATTHGHRHRVPDDLPTARNTWLCLLVWCKACFHRGPADLIIDAGQGHRPLKDLRFRCAKCAVG